MFMGDVIVYNSTLKQHIKLLDQVFTILQENEFYLKLAKYEFAKSELEYLGHVISATGVATEPSKIVVGSPCMYYLLQ